MIVAFALAGIPMGDWLVRQVTIFGGVPAQNWMLLALAVILISTVFSWWSRR
jgi:hypothetical protein